MAVNLQSFKDDYNSIHGALLIMNRSIQAEGAFGIIKQDRQCRRIIKKGLESVNIEMTLISLGFNLYKYHNKKRRSYTIN